MTSARSNASSLAPSEAGSSVSPARIRPPPARIASSAGSFKSTEPTSTSTVDEVVRSEALRSVTSQALDFGSGVRFLRAASPLPIDLPTHYRPGSHPAVRSRAAAVPRVECGGQLCVLLLHRQPVVCRISAPDQHPQVRAPSPSERPLPTRPQHAAQIAPKRLAARHVLSGRALVRPGLMWQCSLVAPV